MSNRCVRKRPWTESSCLRRGESKSNWRSREVVCANKAETYFLDASHAVGENTEPFGVWCRTLSACGKRAFVDRGCRSRTRSTHGSNLSARSGWKAGGFDMQHCRKLRQNRFFAGVPARRRSASSVRHVRCRTLSACGERAVVDRGCRLRTRSTHGSNLSARSGWKAGGPLQKPRVLKRMCANGREDPPRRGGPPNARRVRLREREEERKREGTTWSWFDCRERALCPPPSLREGASEPERGSSW